MSTVLFAFNCINFFSHLKQFLSHGSNCLDLSVFTLLVQCSCVILYLSPCYSSNKHPIMSDD